jgi:hypothetical protein
MSFKTEGYKPDKVRMISGLSEVYAYWNALRGGKTMPVWADFDWMGLPPSVIPWCTVLDVVRDDLDFVYRFWGTQRTNLQGKDYTGVSIRAVVPKSLSEKIWEEYSSVAETGEPVYFTTGNIVNQDGEALKYHFLRLPFGKGDEVSQILSVGLHEEREIKKIQNFFDMLP